MQDDDAVFGSPYSNAAKLRVAEAMKMRTTPHGFKANGNADSCLECGGLPRASRPHQEWEEKVATDGLLPPESQVTATEVMGLEFSEWLRWFGVALGGVSGENITAREVVAAAAAIADESLEEIKRRRGP